jgi:hypothetical protein
MIKEESLMRALGVMESRPQFDITHIETAEDPAWGAYLRKR